jgi:hypothetical protein
MCPGPSIITWTSCFHAFWVSSPSVSSSANCARSFASATEPVFLHELADVLEMRVEEALAVMSEAPLRHDRAAARDDAGRAICRERHESEPHTGVDGEIVDSLLGLLDESLHEHVDVEIFGASVYFLESLVDRHGSDRHRRVSHDGLPGRVDIGARREIHHRVGAPLDGPAELFDFVVDRRQDRGVADVGVDLHEEALADHHRLQLRMIHVRRKDRASRCDFCANDLGIDALSQRREAHLFGDLAAASPVHLREVGRAGAATSLRPRRS